MDWYIGKEWSLPRKGLRKKVLSLNFIELEKPFIASKLQFKVHKVENINARRTKYLAVEKHEISQNIELGTALTPVDCYVDILLRQMIVGEKAECYIKTKTQESDIIFVLTLEKIIENKQIHKLTVVEMYNLALRFKENGVAIFKQYPIFAHDYFNRAAKCLLCYKPFDNLTIAKDGIDGRMMKNLLIQIQTNLAACLIAEQRYEDAIYQTQFVETETNPSEKSIYRRALAFWQLKEFEAAQKTIVRFPIYSQKKEFLNLQKNIKESWKSSNNHYKSVVQKMFR